MRPRYEEGVKRARAITDKSKIRDEVRKLNDEVASWTIAIANRHGLHDFLRQALQLDPVLESIRGQIEGQLEKPVTTLPNRRIQEMVTPTLPPPPNGTWAGCTTAD